MISISFVLIFRRYSFIITRSILFRETVLSIYVTHLVVVFFITEIWQLVIVQSAKIMWLRSPISALLVSSVMIPILPILVPSFQSNGQLRRVWLTIVSQQSQMFGPLAFCYGKSPHMVCLHILEWSSPRSTSFWSPDTGWSVLLVVRHGFTI